MSRRHVVGIDLGTTNSVLAYVPLDGESAAVQLLPIPQLVAASTIESRTSLPSFLYLPPEREQQSGVYDLPWSEDATLVVGELARRMAADNPDRTISAAKSWLCHGGVDRRQAILPWQAAADVRKLSPVAVSQRFLEHLAAAWQAAMPDAPLAQQAVVLTVPASFDAVARELTREAAMAAGLPEDLVLLEEPQAALYSWLVDRGDQWRKILKVGDRLLVCDVGGGTTDLTLIAAAEDAGELVLERIAVGNHLLVGGDNMDLALAYHVSGRFAEKGIQLDPWQSVSLWHSCRAAKELLLDDQGPEKHTISVLGRGSKVIGGTISVDVQRDEVSDLLLNGFFPNCRVDHRPERRCASGFHELGLPFEHDAAITRHLAAFLGGHQSTDASGLPTHVLFNGGVFKADAFRQQLMSVLANWNPQADPQVLEGQHDLDHAVAKGAAYYGWTKQHGGVRIRGGVGRSYYIGIETSGPAIPGAPRPLRAMCVVPFGMEEGTQHEIPATGVGLVLGEPAHFRFFSSATRQQDRPGDTIGRWSEDELQESAPLETVLTADEPQAGYVPVQFQARITELGVLELYCVAAGDEGPWKLEFQVRDDGA